MAELEAYVSETDLGRALEFMDQPQDVEVYRGGDWVLGSMIGWRREEGGACRIMVRLTEEGEGKTAWADLREVRLPEDGAFPGTQSLPFLPGLPQARMDRPASKATDAVTSWWLSWDVSADVPEVEPTRLLTLRRPRQR